MQQLNKIGNENILVKGTICFHFGKKCLDKDKLIVVDR